MYVLALLVKSGGEKSIKILLVKLRNTPARSVDLVLFTYEFFASLVMRMLLLAQPDQRTVLIGSVVTAVWEFTLRMGFLWRYHKQLLGIFVLHAEMESYSDLANMPDEKMAAFVRQVKAQQRRAMVLTANTSGDMIVEYLSANSAMIILLYAADLHGAFALPGEGLTTSQAALALLAQHGPELVCDAAATYAEMRLGLPVAKYMRQQRQPHVVLAKLLIATAQVFLLLAMLRK